MKLRISDRLALPLEWMTMATVIYGARGSGKTTLGSVVAEEVSKAKHRFCAIDLKGDWWGLKASADSKGEGLPVVVFGGDHKDLPLEEGSGAFIAETIAHLEQSTIVDLENFSKGKQVRFLRDFFLALYHHNREPLLLLADESQRYAPQATRGTGGEIMECLGAVEDVVKLGRKHGIGVLLLTQRGAGLNKEVSELCDMLIAFRTPGPLDQDRVKEWLDANVTREQRDEVMGQLSGLPTGTAIVASGHPDLKVFGTYQIRRRETFDSSATPDIRRRGRRAEPKRLAKPDLDALKTKMAEAIERAEAEDPNKLRVKLATMQRELQTAIAKATALEERLQNKKPAAESGPVFRAMQKQVAQATRAVEAAMKFVVTVKAFECEAGDQADLETAVTTAVKQIVSGFDRRVERLIASATGLKKEASRIEKLMGAMLEEKIDLTVDVQRQEPFKVMAPKPVKARTPTSAEADGDLDGSKIAIMTIVAMLRQREIEASKDCVAAWLDIHPRGGRFNSNVKFLHDHGYLEDWQTTVKSFQSEFETDVRGAQSALQPVQQEMLEIIQDRAGLSKEELATEMGVHPRGGRFNTNLRRLRRMGLVTWDGPLKPEPAFFR